MALDSRGTAERYFPIVTSDTVNFAFTDGGGTKYTACRAIRCGGAGDVVAVGLDDVAVTFKNVAQGETLEIQAKRINTATTATFMVALC